MPNADPLLLDAEHSYLLPAVLPILLTVKFEVTLEENSPACSVEWLMAMSPPADSVAPLCFHTMALGVGFPMKVHSSSRVFVSLTWVTAGMVVVKTGLTIRDKI